MPTSKPRIDLRPGVTEPVVLMISRRQVQERDLASVLESLKPFTAAREDAWLYRGQMALVVDGYNEDPRELVDIAEVRVFLKSLYEAWPYWAFFFNQVDDSIKSSDRVSVALHSLVVERWRWMSKSLVIFCVGVFMASTCCSTSMDFLSRTWKS
jgi:hypothetical protein